MRAGRGTGCTAGTCVSVAARRHRSCVRARGPLAFSQPRPLTTRPRAPAALTAGQLHAGRGDMVLADAVAPAVWALAVQKGVAPVHLHSARRRRGRTHWSTHARAPVRKPLLQHTPTLQRAAVNDASMGLSACIRRRLATCVGSHGRTRGVTVQALRHHMHALCTSYLGRRLRGAPRFHRVGRAGVGRRAGCEHTTCKISTSHAK